MEENKKKVDSNAHPDVDGKEYELPAHGETQTRKESEAGSKSHVEAAPTS